MIGLLSISRRQTLHQLGSAGAAALIASGYLAACSGIVVSQPIDDDDALLARLVAQKPSHIPRRDRPYRLVRPLILGEGVHLTIAPGTRFLWEGAAQSADGGPAFAFNAVGDNVTIAVPSGQEATVESPHPNPKLYAVGMRGRRGLSVTGIQGIDCCHVFVGPLAAGYDDVRMVGTNSNTARNIQIRGGGSRFKARAPDGDGACYLAYVENCKVDGAQYENMMHGVQWWGGDANFSRDGEFTNERKCRSIVIRNVTVRNVTGGIWGSMGRDVVVQDCLVENCSDVGFDAEGSTNVLFERCVSINARNGCFATFFYCDGVRFVDCEGRVDDKDFALMRVYNASQDSVKNRQLEIRGGKFWCTDQTGPSSIDTTSGPVREFTMTGAKLSNVRVDTAHMNMHRTVICDNQITFPYTLPPGAAIRAGSSKVQTVSGVRAPGTVVIEGNHIVYHGLSRASTATIAIEVIEDDYNSSAIDRIVDNTVSGSFAVAISLINASKNAGVIPSFTVERNRFVRLAPSAKVLDVVSKGGALKPPAVLWDDTQARDGRTINLSRAQS
jgi:hypothetical protein